MSSYYRIQDADTDVALLLDPAHQWSCSWGGDDDVREGVSVCGNEITVLRYFAARKDCGYDADFLADLVMVEVDAVETGEDDCDAAEGALLVRPTRVLSVRALDADDIATILA